MLRRTMGRSLGYRSTLLECLSVSTRGSALSTSACRIRDLLPDLEGACADIHAILSVLRAVPVRQAVDKPSALHAVGSRRAPSLESVSRLFTWFEIGPKV